MKKVLLSLATIASLNAGFSQVVYQEDFNTDDGSWTVEAGFDWEWGVPSTADINYDDDPCGQSAWVTNLDGDYSNSANAIVTSPTIDCGLLAADPTIAFDLYHITENNFDECWMEFSLDDGVTWTKLVDGGSATNWYNDTFNEWWENDNGGWTTTTNVIPGAAGVSTVRVRFVFSSDGSVTRQGIGFDNMVVTDSYESATMNGVTNIMSGLVYSSAENIEVSITNNGSADITGMTACYSVNGAPAVCEAIPTPIVPGDNTYTFTATEDFSTTGSYDIETYFMALPADVFSCDDTANVTVDLIDPIVTFPYVEDFEGGSDFTTEGDWELGIPTVGSDFDNTLACADDQEVMGTTIGGDYSNGAFDYAYSAIFDFSALTADPYVMFDFFYETETCCDEGWLEVSTDGGTIWSKVGASGSGLNWYNDAGNQWWDGLSGGWVYAYSELTGLAGEANVQFRFVLSTDGSVTRPGFAVDNFTIQENEPSIIDASPTNLSVPNYITCGFSTNDLLTGEFTNFGIDSLFGYTLCYDLGAGPVCETFTDTILPGEVITYEFMTPVDLTTSLSHDITLIISNGADLRSCNDTALFNLTTTVIGLTDTTTVTNISCNGDTDGSAFISPMNGTPGYSVSWDAGSTGFSISGLGAGYHAYTITDNNGCTLTDSVEIIEPDAISLSTVVTDETETGNGEIDLTVTGGTPFFTYDWDNDGTGDFDGEDLTGLTGGTYTVVVTDANGCTETTTATVNSFVSIDENGIGALVVFPNPVQNLLTIQNLSIEGNGNIELFNTQGKLVNVSTLNDFNGNFEIDMSELERGIYLLRVTTENSTSEIRVVKQ